MSIYPEDNIRPIDSVVTIQCHSTGNPEPSLSWSKDGQPLITSAEGQYFFNFVDDQKTIN